MTDREIEEYVEKKAVELGDHFDSVQIMVSWNEEGVSRCLKRGNGNWYARQGMSHEFITESQAQIQADCIVEQFREEDDE